MKFLLTERTPLFHRWSLQSIEPFAEIKYTLESKSVRIQFEEKRLFFLEMRGPLQQKLHVKSEYGVVLARIDLPKSAGMGIVTLDDTSFHYDIYNAAIKLFNLQNNLLTECTIEPYENIPNFELAALTFAYTWIYQHDYSKKLSSLA
jgi:hypothetical protein